MEDTQITLPMKLIIGENVDMKATLVKVREALKSIRFAQGIAEDERWLERASGYKQAADWLEEAIGK